MRLAGEVALVTGAGRGLGAAIADVLEAEGASVARTDLVGADVRLDVRDRASVEAGVREVVATFGTPTVLVNNAGVNRVGPSEELEETDWAEVIDVNLSGAFRVAQAVGRRMLAEGRGSIVNVASIVTFLGNPGRAAYCASKAGVAGLTRALASEWASRGVRVNAVCPGYVRTAIVESAIAHGLLAEDGVVERTPAGRLATPEEVARAVAFLASPDAGFVTGQTLVVDGGYAIYGAPGPASSVPQRSYTLS